MAKTVLAIIFFFTNIFYLKSQTLFGITFNGGSNNGGTLNKFIADIKSFNAERSLDAGGFAAYPAMTNLIQASEGVLYGMTSLGGSNGYGAIFSFDPVSSTYKKLKDFGYTDGGIPLGSLVQANDGKLYGMTSGGGANGYGIIFSYDPSSASYSVVEQFNNTDGASPEGSLIQASDGKLYGMTTAGGSSNEGVIFTFDPGTSMYTKLKDLDDNTGSAPTGSFLQASDGKLYGMASTGGSNSSGTIFSFDPATATFTKLKDLDNSAGSSPLGSLLQATDGKLYGMTTRGGIYDQGVIFSFDLVSSIYMKVKDFAYGDGAGPQGSLMQASDGNLYGMTRSGGFEGAGVIFSLDPVNNIYTQLMDFDLVHGGYPQGSVIQATNGKLYGLTSMGLGGDAGSFGVIFSLDISNYAYNIEKGFGANQNGTNVSGGLIRASDGKLYGMTTNGGSGGWGVIFSFDPASSTYTKLKDFDYSNGSHPYGSLLRAPDGKLYGLTSHGGDREPVCCDYGDVGIIFSYDPVTSMLTKLMRFDNYFAGSGSFPFGSLTGGNNGKLYGLTSAGGSGYRGAGAGVLFSFDTAASSYSMRDLLACNINCLIDGNDSNGVAPYGSLLRANDGKLYGMTSLGGNNHYGVIFSYEPNTSTYTKLVEFDSANGANPYGSLIQARDGKLYGMTYGGGSSDAGVIFSYDPVSSTYRKLTNFDFVNGGHPYGNLMQASDGKLYGSTSSGGISDFGVIFSYDPVSSTYTKLIDYDGSNGANPYFGSAFIELATSAPLPVMIINFTGANMGNINQLSWNVGEENNLAHYELQRSFDGQHFNYVSQIKAAGTASYTYRDNIAAAVNPEYFYRLKIVDIDGNFKYSEVIKITPNLKGPFVVAHPNPFKDVLTVRVTSQTQDKAIFVLKDLSGRKLFNRSEEISAGTNVVSINEIGRLSSGTYLLTIFTSYRTQTVKVVKVN